MSVFDIELVSVNKDYGTSRIVKDVSLAIPKGEFVSILGPSGCGKTTTLNMIAGFLEPTSGAIRIRGQDQAGVLPEKRNIGLVFQNYALFPHMTVAENVGFGLRMRAGRGRRSRRAWSARSRARVWKDMTRATPTSSPAVSSSERRWRARSLRGRPFCCSTSRCRTSISSCARPCGSSSRRFSNSSA